MRKERVESNFGHAQESLKLCRRGEVGVNGHNLALHADILIKEGITWQEIGTSSGEVHDYLVQDYKDALRQIRDGAATVDEANSALVCLRAYFLRSDSGFETPFIISLDELGLTEAELEALEKSVDVRAAREELERCRQTGPTAAFWGLKANLISERITIEEIGATDEEITKYTKLYLKGNPYSGWEQPVVTKTTKPKSSLRS